MICPLYWLPASTRQYSNPLDDLLSLLVTGICKKIQQSSWWFVVFIGCQHLQDNTAILVIICPPYWLPESARQYSNPLDLSSLLVTGVCKTIHKSSWWFVLFIGCRHLQDNTEILVMICLVYWLPASARQHSNPRDDLYFLLVVGIYKTIQQSSWFVLFIGYRSLQDNTAILVMICPLYWLPA